MATVAEWVEGARPRTLPTAVAPVLAGCGAAAGVAGFDLVAAILAMIVSVGLVIGVNYANDYSDGIRGTDDDRVGPLRLVGSGVAQPYKVRRAAVACLGTAAVAGVALSLYSGHWWLILVGAACLLGAWFYTGGSRPYGYRGFGEVAVFVFFGPVAVLGTEFVQTGRASGLGIGASVGVGLLACAVLVANNLRDISSDVETGKRTLAVVLGDRDTRVLYAALVVVPLGMTLVLSLRAWGALAGLLALVLLVPSLRRVLAGSTGPQLIPVLRDTALGLLVWSAATALGLALT
ncbi:1,4-dihydroxy-2-naphthoate octaprenyltransferase [Actinomycetospora sp. NBRC 106375]|uniref:1,4-dihydroxy-2-naphthoate polyprenyltransferase n=1 Tax=Actinomycetospora sp. NBRC 106375 TaxID=3032207 RepID=UPI0024A524BD|nr:1,4-dihydroxy-2-naphthoate polyprenyltransferase [Actinomycetospora sp. NBRC 106375]GLZ44771.1 1,4-dihydroxy-2-naphthoate octaprenyltransferase [Actinomycetospora sp. NBRC 106375]